MTKAKLIALGLGTLMIVAAFGLVLWQGTSSTTAATAFAQAPATPTTAPAAQPTQAPSSVTGVASDILNAFWNSLASKLGIGVDTLKSDFTSAEKDAIEQAVKDGNLTRAQADRLEQNLNSNNPVGPFFRGFPGGFGKGPMMRRGSGLGMHVPFFGGANTIEAVANVLNLKPADLITQLRSGKTLADISTAQNVDQARVKQAIIDATKAEVQRQVQDGLITQAQADQILSNLTPDKIDLTKMRGFGGMGWR